MTKSLDDAEKLVDREKRLLAELERAQLKMDSTKPMSRTDILISFNRMAKLGRSRISHYSRARDEPEVIEIFDSSDEENVPKGTNSMVNGFSEEQENVHKCTNGCCELGRILKELRSSRKKSKRKRMKYDISNSSQ